MAPAAKIPLPTGTLGVTFKGTPPTVVGIAPDSPMVGKIKEGYVFDALYLKDGTEFVRLSTTELIQTLGEHKGEEGRKMRMHMKLPDSTKVVLPSGDFGATIEGSPPTITKINDSSPLKSLLRVGLVVDTLTLEDGTEMTGYPVEELLAALKDDEQSDQRTLLLKNASKVGVATKSLKLPDEKEVMLPSGKLGAFFKGSSRSMIARLAEDSPMRGYFRVGMIVDSFALADETVYTGLKPDALIDSLALSADSEGRKMILRSPTSLNLTKKSTTKFLLPTGDGYDLGVSFSGDPAMVSEVAETSPLQGKVRPGQIVDNIALADETEYDELDSEEVLDVLHMTSQSEGRTILLENKEPPAELPDELEVALPAGKLGVMFKGAPPKIIRINEESPVAMDFMVGLVVDVLTLENGEKFYQMTTSTLTKTLSANIESEGRVVLLKNPNTSSLSNKEDVPLPDELKITLPSGKLGVAFKGNPPVITKISPESSVKNDFVIGMAVDTLKLSDGTLMTEMTATSLTKALGGSAETEGREVVLKNPVTGTFTKKPDSVEVALPTGKLGTIFKGTPPLITKVNEGSPMKDQFMVGLVVDMLTLGDGTVMSGLSTNELVKALNETAAEEGRTILLKNPMTRSVSAKSLILPDEKEIILPTGKLGVSFKGNPPVVTRLSEKSPMHGILRIGMAVDTLEVPGDNAAFFAGLTSKELVSMLAGSADVDGRKMVLKNPETAEFMKRAVSQGDAPVEFDEISLRG